MSVSVMSVVTLLGGLGLLLFGIKNLGDGLEQMAGDKMRRLLEVLTRNKLMCVLVGALITAAIQSSTATTLMVVGFVNAGLLPLSRAIGVIMGANIGTTVTSLLLSVKVDFGAVFMAAGAVCQLVSKKDKVKLFGQIMMGLGMLFLGMTTMVNAMAPFTEWEGFRRLMLTATNPIVGVLVGALITMVLHSSAASVGILQALAASGAISLRGSMFILFGQNIGTCVTALVSSASANRTAKRAAVVHLLFNVLGTVLFVILALVLPLDRWIIAAAGRENLKLQIALTHICFNIATTLVLLPCSALLEKLACLIVPGEDAVPAEAEGLRYFDSRMFSTPAVAVEQLFRETCRMSEIVMANFTYAADFFFHPGEGVRDPEFDTREDIIDNLNAEITRNLIEVRALKLSKRDVHLAGSLFHVVNDLERIGDHSTNIVEIGEAKAKLKSKFSAKAEHELEDLIARVTKMLEKSVHIVREQITDPGVIGEVIALESEVDDLSAALADHHIDRVKEKKCTPRNGMLYLDMLNNLERIADHADNLSASVDKGEGREEARMMW